MAITTGKLIEMAASIGLPALGVTTTKPLRVMRERLQRRVAEKRVTPFEEADPEKRLDPSLLMTEARSIITLALPFGETAPQFDDSPAQLKGKVARCARSLDYHLMIMTKANHLTELMQRQDRRHRETMILADRSPLVERELAYQSGLGWIGENCTLNIPASGSYCALGTILTPLELEPTNPTADQCLHCGQCREACPTGAIIEPYTIDPHRCLAYLTQAGGLFPRALRPLLANRLYGCDSCQEACPRNCDHRSSEEPAASFQFFPAEPMLLPILKMTLKEFDLTIGLTAAGWRGKTTMQRNAVIALGNSRDPGVVKPLAQLLSNDPRPLIRIHSAWALGRIGGSTARYYLHKAAEKDPDQAVREEALLALS